MSSFYSITPLSGQMLVKDHSGEITFTVKNNHTQTLQTRFAIGNEVKSPAKDWLQVVTAPQRIAPNGTTQVMVRMTAPAGQTGSFDFYITAAAVPNTEEDFTPGPTISFTLVKGVPEKAPPARIKWWMILIGVVVVLGIAGGVLAVVLRSHKTVPHVVGEKTEAATHNLEQAGLTAKVNERYYSGKDGGLVQKQTPDAGAPIPDDKTITLEVSSSLAVVPCVEKFPLFQAVSMLKAAGLDAGDETYTTNGTDASNTVVTQNPRNEICTVNGRGLKVAAGTKVNLVIKK